MGLHVSSPTTQTVRFADNTGTGLEGLTAWTSVLWTKTPASMTAFRTFACLSKNGVSRTDFASAGGASAGLVRIAGQVSYTGADAFYTCDPIIPAATWVCIAITFDSGASAGNFLRLFYGTLTSRLALQTATFVQNPTGAIDTDTGASLDFGDPAWTAIAAHEHTPAKFILYNSRLTDAQIIAHQWDFRIKHAGCVCYYEFGTDGASAVTDLSGNGHNLSTTNSPTVADHVPLGAPFGYMDHSPYIAAAAPGVTGSDNRLLLMGVGR